MFQSRFPIPARRKAWKLQRGKLEKETKQEDIITQSVKSQIGSKFIGQNWQNNRKSISEKNLPQIL